MLNRLIASSIIILNVLLTHIITCQVMSTILLSGKYLILSSQISRARARLLIRCWTEVSIDWCIYISYCFII